VREGAEDEEDQVVVFWSRLKAETYFRGQKPTILFELVGPTEQVAEKVKIICFKALRWRSARAVGREELVCLCFGSQGSVMLYPGLLSRHAYGVRSRGHLNAIHLRVDTVDVVDLVD